MKMQEAALSGPTAAPLASPEVFHQPGALTRRLHDALTHLA